jgi:hypothetical protein
MYEERTQSQKKARTIAARLHVQDNNNAPHSSSSSASSTATLDFFERELGLARFVAGSFFEDDAR